MHRSETPTTSPGSLGGSRQAIIEGLIDVLPRVKRRITAEMSACPSAQLATVTPHQADALCLLARYGEMTMHDLAEALNVAMSTATALADRLVKQGVADRITNPSDRRVVRLAATPLAKETIRRYQEGRRQAVMTALDVLDDGELGTLLHLLSTVAAGGHAPITRD